MENEFETISIKIRIQNVKPDKTTYEILIEKEKMKEVFKIGRLTEKICLVFPTRDLKMIGKDHLAIVREKLLMNGIISSDTVVSSIDEVFPEEG